MPACPLPRHSEGAQRPWESVNFGKLPKMCHPDRNKVEWRDLGTSGSGQSAYIRQVRRSFDSAQDDIWGKIAVFLNTLTIIDIQGQSCIFPYL